MAAKKYLPVRAICKHIVDHSVAIITAIYCILIHAIVGALRQKRNTVHETYDVVHHWLFHSCHIGIFPHLFFVGKFHPRKWMTPQQPHNFFQHPIYRTAANSRGDAKNKAKMFVGHCATSVDPIFDLPNFYFIYSYVNVYLTCN